MLLSCWNSFYILDNNPLLNMWFAKIFSDSIDLSLHSVDCFFSSSRATFPCSPPAQFCHQLFLLFVTPWTAAHHASLCFTISKSLFQFMPTESVMLFNHLILCRPLLLLPSVFASIRGNYWPQILSLSSTSHSVSPLSSSFLLGKVTGFFTCSFISHILLCD